MSTTTCPTERHVIIVRVEAKGRYQTFFPEYDVVNRPGFAVINGALTPSP